MTEPRRRERTAALLVAHLDALAQAATGMPHAELERLVERAAVATSRAVALELLEADRAAEIWRDAHARHPDLPYVVLASQTPLAA